MPHNNPEPDYIQYQNSYLLADLDRSVSFMRIGIGWKGGQFDGQKIDIDGSILLLDRHNQTRHDQDFIYFNNLKSAQNEVIHHGDSLTGAGEGDDESIDIDLRALHFDVFQVHLIISFYQPDQHEWDLSKVQNLYVRLCNNATQSEFARYMISEIPVNLTGCHAITALILERQGMDWVVRPEAIIHKNGLIDPASAAGLIIGAH